MTVLNVLGKNYPIKDVIGEIKNEKYDKAIVFLGGIHGNEPSGYTALCDVFPLINELKDELNGEVYAYGGNLNALRQNKRFIDKDLNRIWLHSNIDKIHSGELTEENAEDEWKDFVRLNKRIEALLKRGLKLFIIDLHTTSSQSIPFITINDQIGNRDYSRKFPVPIILGIEEYLSGPLLSYMNEFGHISMAFEAGQHDDKASYEAQKAFVWLAMANAGVLSKEDVPDYKTHHKLLTGENEIAGDVFEVRHRQSVEPLDEFVMNPGYYNFKPIKENDNVARDNNGSINVNETGRIFMPLYQKEGEDGFFIVRKVPLWALGLSKFLRRINFENFLTILPGVSRVKNQPHVLEVNSRIARFLSKELFHLLGYRRKTKSDNGKMVFSKREIV